MDRRKKQSRADYTLSELLVAVMFRPMDRRTRQSRTAFTLIELLVVILIIGLLIGLLLPAIQAAIRGAHNAQVSAEMNNLATALASFKNLYGDYPPSRVILCESGYTAFQNNNAALLTTAVGPTTNALPGATGTDTDITYSQLITRSQIYLNRFWPRVDFNNGTIAFDFNNNGVLGENLILSGSECLTFFLGGIPVKNGNGTLAVTGFSRSPLNPFQNNLVATNRTNQNYEFVVGRLIDQDGDNIPSYIDPINSVQGSRRSYAYFFSYGSNSYDPNDVNGYGRAFDLSNTLADAGDFETDDDSTGTYSTWGFLVGFPTTSTTANFAVSPSPNPYTTGPSSSGNVAWVNPTTFQLICSGQDGFFGLGGTYAGKSGGAGVLPISATDPGNINAISVRVRENDNITNFSGGTLN
jgi:prepilin-type N-terminal cleavage/methylation domain-containing protein